MKDLLEPLLEAWKRNNTVMLHLLLWHEGYHHGQMKLALKFSGMPMADGRAGPLTWDVWRARL